MALFSKFWEVARFLKFWEVALFAKFWEVARFVKFWEVTLFAKLLRAGGLKTALRMRRFRMPSGGGLFAVSGAMY